MIIEEDGADGDLLQFSETDLDELGEAKCKCL